MKQKKAEMARFSASLAFVFAARRTVGLVHHSVILEFGGESQRGPKSQRGAQPTG
jgi:hypothetical protein